jgi:hypothetical protein
MAHFVQTLSGDGYLNLDNIDGFSIIRSTAPGGMHIVVAERHGRTNTILGQRTSHQDALDFIRALLGDAIHDSEAA